MVNKQSLDDNIIKLQGGTYTLLDPKEQDWPTHRETRDGLYNQTCFLRDSEGFICITDEEFDRPLRLPDFVKTADQGEQFVRLAGHWYHKGKRSGEIKKEFEVKRKFKDLLSAMGIEDE